MATIRTTTHRHNRDQPELLRERPQARLVSGGYDDCEPRVTAEAGRGPFPVPMSTSRGLTLLPTRFASSSQRGDALGASHARVTRAELRPLQGRWRSLAILQTMSNSRCGPHRSRQRRSPAHILGCALTVAVAAVGAPRSVRAGNLDSYYFDDTAPLQGGAVTADISTGGAVWYNPAGLAATNATRLDASVAAYGIRFGARTQVEASSPSARIERLEMIDLNIVPAALSAVRVWEPLSVGFGVFVPQQQSTVLRTRVVHASTADESPPQLAVDAYGHSQTYAAGPAVAMTLDPRVRVGVALLGTYRNDLSLTDGALLVSIGGEKAEVVSHDMLDWQQFGVQAVLGVQLLPARAWKLGFTLRLPSMRIYELRQEITVDSVGATAANDDDVVTLDSEFEEFDGFSPAIVGPPRFHAGLAHQRGRNRFAFDASYQAPFSSANPQVDWKPTLNGRIGWRHDVEGDVAVGGGLFTDMSPERRPGGSSNAQLDYFGLTVSLHLGTPYRLVASDPQERAPSTFVFGTTFALSYALGIGRVEGARIDLSTIDLHSTTEDAVAHELFLHVASSLSE